MPSIFRNLTNKFFGIPFKKTTPPSIASTSPKVKTGQDHINDLDQILQNIDKKFRDFLETVKNKNISRIMSHDINFIHPIEKVKHKVSKSQLVPAPKDIDFKSTPPSLPKKNLPINNVFEVKHLEWRKRAGGLKDLMDGSVIDIQNYLINLARNVGYNPSKTDLKSLTNDLYKNKFVGLDRNVVLEIIKRLKIFKIAYNQLLTWFNLFQNTEKKQFKAYQKKI